MSKKFNISDAVRSVQIGECIIRTPKIRGSLGSVFISKSQSSRIEYVYKFNHPALALKKRGCCQNAERPWNPSPRNQYTFKFRSMF